MVQSENLNRLKFGIPYGPASIGTRDNIDIPKSKKKTNKRESRPFAIYDAELKTESKLIKSRI